MSNDTNNATRYTIVTSSRRGNLDSLAAILSAEGILVGSNHAYRVRDAGLEFVAEFVTFPGNSGRVNDLAGLYSSAVTSEAPCFAAAAG